MVKAASKPGDPGYVGRGHPPVEHQFKKGTSGNPAGRPRGRHSLISQIYEELQKDIPLPNGNTIALPKLIASSLTAQISRAKHTQPIELTIKIGEKAEGLLASMHEEQQQAIDLGKQANLEAALDRILKERQTKAGEEVTPE